MSRPEIWWSFLEGVSSVRERTNSLDFVTVANHPLHRYHESEQNEEAVKRDQAKEKSEKKKKEKQKGAM
ncbi:hypothetical protein Q7C36_019550 [Tachysurus vachellii]|uniref:Uncharacterized protein n=1 Tax=Tachysurus vachellii TaxID=175792 RepID=A0AA88LWJ1_TACVA|nr:hypothetical protein Q7C36_019550 [Tachysurus vachellii]